MNTYQKYIINSTKITIAYISSQKSIVQISNQLHNDINLYEKDKWILQ
jgi:hypothetical protein